MRRLKTKRALFREAVGRGITSIGGLNRAICKRPPLEKQTRIGISKLRYQLKKIKK